MASLAPSGRQLMGFVSRTVLSICWLAAAASFTLPVEAAKPPELRPWLALPQTWVRDTEGYWKRLGWRWEDDHVRPESAP